MPSLRDEFIAGHVGGIFGICVVYPLDTAKIRMQIYRQYTSPIHVFKDMIAADGVSYY